MREYFNLIEFITLGASRINLVLLEIYIDICTVVVRSLNCVQLFVTSWTAVCQASLFFTISKILLKLMSIALVMPFNHLILCHPLILLLLSQNQGFFQVYFFASGGQYIHICIYICKYSMTYFILYMNGFPRLWQRSDTKVNETRSLYLEQIKM